MYLKFILYVSLLSFPPGDVIPLLRRAPEAPEINQAWGSRSRERGMSDRQEATLRLVYLTPAPTRRTLLATDNLSGAVVLWSLRSQKALMFLDVLVLVDRTCSVLILKMCFMAVDPAIIAAGIAATASTINAGSQANYAGKNRRQSEKLMKWQHDINLTDWGLENEYNSPANQMKRLKDAGLNPNLIYGSGSGGMQGGSVNSTSAPQSHMEAPQFDVSGVLKAFIDLSLLDKQKDLLSAQVAATRANAQLTDSTIPLREQELAQKNMLFPGQLTALELANRKTLADTQFTLHQDERAAALQEMNLKLGDQNIQKAIQEVLLLRLSRSKVAAERDHIRQQIENLKSEKTKTELETKLMRSRPSPANFLRVVGDYIGDTKLVERVKAEYQNARDSWSKEDSTDYKKLYHLKK